MASEKGRGRGSAGSRPPAAGSKIWTVWSLAGAPTWPGVTRAVEHRDYPFVIGVQWHPEFMPQSEGQFGLFIALTAAAADKQRERLGEALSNS
ncbi:MAG: hypothetical protein SV429_07010 [Pseudomonadota bacterium]|nr:hypothetical protein [Pseudomonadota bacterium]